LPKPVVVEEISEREKLSLTSVIEPSIVTAFACTVMLPPLPKLEVPALISPPFVKLHEPAPVVRVSLTAPALPELLVDEEICEMISESVLLKSLLSG
jgi:hypothetical protein